MAEQNFSMHSGDSKSLSVSITNAAGTPVDVSTAAAIVWTLAASPTSAALVTKGLGDGVTVSTSTVTVALDPEDTDDLAGLYYQEMQVTDGSGNVSTVLSGHVLIEGDLVS